MLSAEFAAVVRVCFASYRALRVSINRCTASVQVPCIPTTKSAPACMGRKPTGVRMDPSSCPSGARSHQTRGLFESKPATVRFGDSIQSRPVSSSRWRTTAAESRLPRVSTVAPRFASGSGSRTVVCGRPFRSCKRISQRMTSNAQITSRAADADGIIMTGQGVGAVAGGVSAVESGALTRCMRGTARVKGNRVRLSASSVNRVNVIVSMSTRNPSRVFGFAGGACGINEYETTDPSPNTPAIWTLLPRPVGMHDRRNRPFASKTNQPGQRPITTIDPSGNSSMCEAGCGSCRSLVPRKAPCSSKNAARQRVLPADWT